MTRKGLSGMLALLATVALAAPAAAEEATDPVGFTGETADVETTPATEETCKDPETAPLLAEHKDDGLYFVAPGGDFEDGAEGWHLDGGAEVTFGSSAFAPLGAGNRSLRLPPGSTATSPAFCVDDRYPHFRISTGQLGGEKKVKIDVSVVYPGLEKNVRREGDVDADGKARWRLSKKLKVKANHGRKYRGWRLVALRFEVEKADEGVDARVDDILVDPKMR